MSKRGVIGSARSKSMFSKHAAKTHVKNVKAPSRSVMRGGIRL